MRRPLKWSLGVVTALIVLVAILAGLFRLAASVVPRYHEQIQKDVSSALGMPVKLGTVSLGWQGWGPEISFRNVRVMNAETRQVVLSAQRIGFAFTLLGLLHGTHAVPEGIRIEAPHVVAEETADGKIRIPGLVLANTAPVSNLAAMLATRITIADGTFALSFAGNDHAVWNFAPVDLSIGGGQNRAVTLALGMPKALGAGSLHVGGRLDTPGVAVDQWSWSGTWTLDPLTLAPLVRFIPRGYPALQGSLSTSGSFAGRGLSLENAAGRIDARDLAAGSSRLTRLQTRFEFLAAHGYTLSLSDAHLVEPKQTWTPGRLSIGRDAAGRIHLSVGKIALAALAPLTGFLPEKFAPIANRMQTMNPSGEVDALKFALTPGKTDLDLQARLNDVGIQAADKAPGFDHLAGSVAIHAGTGAFRLDAPGFTLRMPHIFHHPVPLDRAAGSIGIAWNKTGLAIVTDKLSLSGPGGLAGVLKGKIGVPRKGPVTLELTARADPIAVVPARKLYLPTGLMPRELDDWLLQDLDGGNIKGATLSFTGQVHRFPFARGGGRFAVDFGFAGVTLKPGKHWEPLEKLNGSVHFLNAGMSAEITGGRIGRSGKVIAASVAIPDLYKPQLSVKATVAGDASDFLAFLGASPIGGDLKSLADLHASGPARARVNLALPIPRIKNFQLDGALTLAGVSARYGSLPYAVNRLAGTVSFDARGPTAGRLKGELVAAPITVGFSRDTRAQNLQITLAGRFPVATLSQVANFDFSSYANGSLPLDAVVTVPLVAKGPPITAAVSSDLHGLALDFPAPVGKPAAAETSFSAHASFDHDGMRIAARYGGVLSACVNLSSASSSAQLQGADVVLGPGTCHEPAAGLDIRGGWATLDIKPWLDRLPRRTSAVGGWSLPEVLGIDLHFGEINAFGQHFGAQTIEAGLGASQMTLDLAGDMLSGQVVIPRRPTNENPVVATLTQAHLILPSLHATAPPPASAATPASAPAAATAPKASDPSFGFEPQDVPPFILRAARMELGKAELKDIYVVVRRVPGGISADPIHVGGRVLKLDGTLVWLDPPGGNPQGALQFTSNVEGLGRLLTGLGLGPVVTGNGAISAGLAWHKPPGENKFANDLLGRISVDFRNGSISQVNPGAGRVLSLLNLANIPRYLVFNFHNLFDKGFPFSRIHGDYVIDHGVATTQGLYIKSSIASIKLTGEVNIAQGTMDQQAEIVPNYFGSLPVIAAIVGGLGIGAAVYAITKLFGSPIVALTKMKYTITGPIRNPLVEPLGKTPPPRAGTRMRPAPAQGAALAPVPASAGGG